MAEEEKPKKTSRGTMTNISLMEKPTRPLQLKPVGAPRKRMNFADEDKRRQSDLSDQEMKLARQIWVKHVEPFQDEFTSLVFDDFFAKYPNMTDLVQRLSDNTTEREIKDHLFARIMIRLREMMDNMDKPERLTKLMTKLGIEFGKHNVDLSGQMLKDLQNAMIATIRSAMNNRMHPQEEVALRKCFEMAFSIMEEASGTYYDLFVAIQ